MIIRKVRTCKRTANAHQAQPGFQALRNFARYPWLAGNRRPDDLQIHTEERRFRGAFPHFLCVFRVFVVQSVPGLAVRHAPRAQS